MAEYAWIEPESDRVYFACVIDGLRRQGWSRNEAEAEALERLENLRAIKTKYQSPSKHPPDRTVG